MVVLEDDSGVLGHGVEWCREKPELKTQ